MKKRHKRCSYMKVNPLDPRKKTTIKNQQETNRQKSDEKYLIQLLMRSELGRYR